MQESRCSKRNTKRADAARRNSKRTDAGRTVPREQVFRKSTTATRSAGRIQQKQQTTEAQPETLQTESLQRRQRQGRQRREQPESPTLRATEAEPQYDWRYEWEKLDKSPGNELVFA